jgi:hypothetical protein
MKGASKKPANLSESLHRQLNSYALAASAAGVGVLAMGQPAEAKVVYRSVHIKIAPGDTFNLDLNHDGKTDFRFSNHSAAGATSEFEFFEDRLKIIASGQNEFLGVESPQPPGVQVGPKRKFRHGYATMESFAQSCRHSSVTFCHTTTRGKWGNINRWYLGFRFFIKGHAHYGWARLNVNVNPNREHEGVFARVTGYAYETIPNKAIIAGKTHGNDVITLEPGSLGPLAAGHNGRK